MLKRGLLFIVIFFLVSTSVEIVVFRTQLDSQLAIRGVVGGILAFLISNYLQGRGK